MSKFSDRPRDRPRKGPPRRSASPPPATLASSRSRPPAAPRPSTPPRPAGPRPTSAPRPASLPPRPHTSGGASGGASGAGTHWGEFAHWYDGLVGDSGSDYHQHVVLPGVLRMLHVHPGEVILDVACGQGVLCRELHRKRCKVTGVDAGGELIRLAQERSDPAITYKVVDAREVGKLSAVPEFTPFHAATCVLAIQNIDPVQGVFDGVAKLLAPGGRFILVMMHPAFRVPKHSHWGWDANARADGGARHHTRAHARDAIQYRRVDRYLLPMKEPITVNPGKSATGRVWAFHRPLQHYINALGAAGLVIDRMEEWPSHRTSDPGPRADAENRARREFPLFLALRAVKR